MDAFKMFFACMTGPKIFYLNSKDRLQSYTTTNFEAPICQLISVFDTALKILKYTSPIWITRVYKQIVHQNHLHSYVSYSVFIVVVYSLLYALRGVARSLNPIYMEFIQIHTDAFLTRSPDSIDKLKEYTFDSTWPAEFSTKPLVTCLPPRKFLPSRATPTENILLPISFFLIKTIGFSLAYPGTISFIQSSTLQFRVNKRKEFQRKYNLKRIGLETVKGNFVEALYADQRGKTTEGNKLILCCEGNAGFPEIGTIELPMSLGYSIIGWNHPGFGSSTGEPYPENDQDAVESALQFALKELKFPLEDVYVFGWSIGGYSASWLAANYPQIGGIIIDASFDDIDELARGALPGLFYPLIIATVHHYIDLNNSGFLNMYNGPARIIRRMQDEIITTGPRNDLASNRGNNLFMNMFKHRYPTLFTVDNEKKLLQFLSKGFTDDCPIFKYEGFDETQCLRLLKKIWSSSENVKFPADVDFTGGEREKDALLFYMATMYFSDAPGSHCEPLRREAFSLPWSEKEELANINET